MGILDEITTTFNKGTAAAERSAKTVKLKAQINEVNKRRQQLASQLGAALYEATKDDASLRTGLESLYDGIAACDAEREEYQNQITAMEQEALVAAQSSQTFNCQKCGTSLSETDLFCSGCGLPASQARPRMQVETIEQAAGFCVSCGAPLSADDVFCMKCGTKVNKQTSSANESSEESAQKEEE